MNLQGSPRQRTDAFKTFNMPAGYYDDRMDRGYGDDFGVFEYLTEKRYLRRKTRQHKVKNHANSV